MPMYNHRRYEDNRCASAAATEAVRTFRAAATDEARPVLDRPLTCVDKYGTKYSEQAIGLTAAGDLVYAIVDPTDVDEETMRLATTTGRARERLRRGICMSVDGETLVPVLATTFNEQLEPHIFIARAVISRRVQNANTNVGRDIKYAAARMGVIEHADRNGPLSNVEFALASLCRNYYRIATGGEADLNVVGRGPESFTAPVRQRGGIRDLTLYARLGARAGDAA